MGAGAAAPTGVGSSPAPVVAPPVSTPIAPVITPTATPAPIKLFPKAGDPQGGKGGNPTAPAAPVTPPGPYNPDLYYGTNTQNAGATPAPVVTPTPVVAPAAPQQPQFNPFMQTYGQNRTPQQQMFNRFPQSFQQPQPVAQPAQGPVYADQSLNAPGNQPQQFQQPQYGRFGRGFMPQNRFGYDRQMDQLRGGYNRPMPQIMPQQDMGYGNGMPYSSPAPSAAPADAEAAWNRTTQAAQFAPGTDMVKAKQDFMQRYNPRPQQLGGMQQAAFMNNLLSGQQQMPAYGGGYGRFGQQGSQVPILKTLGLDAAFGGDADFGDPRNFHFGATSAPNTQLSGAGALAAGLGQPYVQQSPDVQKLQGGQAPAGGKGGNPTAQLPPPPKQDGTPGSWSTYI